MSRPHKSDNTIHSVRDLYESNRSRVNDINSLSRTTIDAMIENDTTFSGNTIDATRNFHNRSVNERNPTRRDRSVNKHNTTFSHTNKHCSFGTDDNQSGTTIDAIREVCNPPCSNIPDSTCERYDPGTSCFNSVITPITNLMAQYTGITGAVEFRMRRKNKTVTLQWEPFSGTIAANGVAFLTVAQSIWNTPPYPISVPIYIRYKDVNRITNLTLDPSAKMGNIKFYLNTDGTGSGINAGDIFYIYASSISWIVD